MNSHTDVSFSSSGKRRLTSSALGFPVLAMVLLALWHRDHISKQVEIVEGGTRTTMELGRFSDARLYDVAAETPIELAKLQHPHKRLLIFLTAADCASCLDSLTDWVQSAQANPPDQFEVDLIYLDTAPNELASFLANNPLPYKVFWDKYGEAKEKANLPLVTPVTVLVDSNFRVLAAQAPESDRRARSAFVTKVKSFLPVPH